MKANYGAFLPEYVRVCPCVCVFLSLLIFTEVRQANFSISIIFSSITSANCAMPVDIFAGSYFL